MHVDFHRKSAWQKHILKQRQQQTELHHQCIRMGKEKASPQECNVECVYLYVYVTEHGS